MLYIVLYILPVIPLLALCQTGLLVVVFLLWTCCPRVEENIYLLLCFRDSLVHSSSVLLYAVCPAHVNSVTHPLCPSLWHQLYQYANVMYSHACYHYTVF